MCKKLSDNDIIWNVSSSLNGTISIRLPFKKRYSNPIHDTNNSLLFCYFIAGIIVIVMVVFIVIVVIIITIVF